MLLARHPEIGRPLPDGMRELIISQGQRVTSRSMRFSRRAIW